MVLTPLLSRTMLPALPEVAADAPEKLSVLKSNDSEALVPVISKRLMITLE